MTDKPLNKEEEERIRLDADRYANGSMWPWARDCAMLLNEVDRARSGMTTLSKELDRMVAELAAKDEEIERLKQSMLNHFNIEHLAGDGPEIDRWKAKIRNLESALTVAVEALERFDAVLKWLESLSAATVGKSLSQQLRPKHTDALAKISALREGRANPTPCQASVHPVATNG